ncbi:MAG: fibronectin type III domain-containing protein [Patescibacteria group bacterium]|nr:fibronectin type III domain-containing protein [Patescibacteria group bacterium]
MTKIERLKSVFFQRKKSQKMRFFSAVVIIVLVASLFPIIFAPHSAKAVKLPGVRYDFRTGNYKVDVPALTYALYGDDRDGNYNIAPGPDTDCAIFYTDATHGRPVCDNTEPLELYDPDPALGNFGIDGTDDIDAITIYLSATPAWKFIALLAHSNVAAFIAFINADPTYVLVDTFSSIFQANGIGNDYIANFGVLAGAPGPGTVSLLGGDGVGGTRDDLAPDSIGDLSAATDLVSGRVELSWTAVNDNVPPAATQTADSYILKYSLNPINNNGDFVAATYYNQSWSPKPVGGAENFIVGGLTAGTTYYFYVKACDKYMNCSPFVGSSVSAAASNAIGTKLPAIWYDHGTGHYKTDIAALEYSGIVDAPLTLAIDESLLNAPFNFSGDSNFLPPDNYQGCSLFMPASGIFGPGTETICDTAGAFGVAEPFKLFDPDPGINNFGIDGTEDVDIVTVFFGLGSPTNFDRQTYLITHSGLNAFLASLGAIPAVHIASVIPSAFQHQGAGKDYDINSDYFISNSFQPLLDPAFPNDPAFSINNSAITVSFWGIDGIGGTRENLPSDPINTLSGVTGSGSGQVNLNWTAVNDYNNSGPIMADSYVLKYSQDPINNNTDFNNATDYIQLWIPQAVGSGERFTVSGLVPNQLYYFSVKACDKYMTCGNIGNTVSARASSPPIFKAYSPVLTINSGDITTGNRLVNLVVVNFDPASTKMAVSNSADFSNPSDPEPIGWWNTDNKWDLCSASDPCLDGIKTVYVRLYNGGGGIVHNTFSSSIELKIATLTTILINDDGTGKSNSSTKNKKVAISIVNPAVGASYLKLSNLADLNDADFQPYTSPITDWDLCRGLSICLNGKKTVYVQLYNSAQKAISDILSASIDLNITYNTVLSINNGNTSTDNEVVDLQIRDANPGATQIKISNQSNLSDSSLKPFFSVNGTATISNWSLCADPAQCSNGEKQVYIQLYDANGGTLSEIISDSIFLDIPLEEKIEEPINLPIVEGTTGGTTSPQTPSGSGLIPSEPTPEPITPEPAPIIPVPQEPGQLTIAIQRISEIATTVGTPISSAVLAATAVLSVVAVANSFVDFLAILRHLIALLLQFLGIKKKNKNWGMVYDSNTKEPMALCIVRLFDAKTGRLVQTAVTDGKGRFGLFPAIGDYYMTVTKPLFSFPSHSLRGITHDVGYSSLYFGEKKFLSGQSIINFAIPLDKFSSEKKLSRTFIAIRSFLISLSTPVAVLGAILSLAILIINPTILNAVIFAVYLLILLFKKLFVAPPKKPAVQIVDYRGRKPIAGLAIEIFSKKYKKLVATKVSDEKGKFDLFLPDGEYFLKTSMDNYDFVSNEKLKNSYDGGTLVVGGDNLFSGLNLYLKKKW